MSNETSRNDLEDSYKKSVNLETLLQKHDIINIFKSLELQPSYDAYEKLNQKESASKPRVYSKFISKISSALFKVKSDK